jgi:hypothetical protein
LILVLAHCGLSCSVPFQPHPAETQRQQTRALGNRKSWKESVKLNLRDLWGLTIAVSLPAKLHVSVREQVGVSVLWFRQMALR